MPDRRLLPHEAAEMLGYEQRGMIYTIMRHGWIVPHKDEHGRNYFLESQIKDAMKWKHYPVIEGVK